MKLMFASDIHGSAHYCRQMLDAFAREEAETLILLGDLLYHDPRNDLPEGYAPKEVITLLNDVSEKLLCVRGNCDTEVDQMVLNFPILADYAVLYLNGRRVSGHSQNLTDQTLFAYTDHVCHIGLPQSGGHHQRAGNLDDFTHRLVTFLLK